MAESFRTGERPGVIRGVAIPGAMGAYNVELAEGLVAAVAPAGGGGEPVRVLLPAFADLHVHADRSYLEPPRPARSLLDAIELVNTLRGAATEDDVSARARQLLGRALTHGTLRVRSHVDVDELVDERSLRGVLRVRDELAGLVELELVAFATTLLDPATDEGRRRLTRAVELGAGYLGAVVSLYRDPAASIDAVLDLAIELGVPVDLHVDETTSPERICLERLAEATLERGLQGRVTAGHCCALASAPSAVAERIIEKVAAADLTIVVLPACNLYLQDRGGGTPRLRGLTLVTELLAASVTVRLATDNVGDAFIPWGDADPLDTAFLGAVGAHMDDELALLAAVADGRQSLAAGDPADLVLVDAPSLRDAISCRPGGRTVLRDGVVVSAAAEKERP